MMPGEFKDFKKRQEAQENIGEAFGMGHPGIIWYLKALFSFPEMGGVFRD